MSETKVEDFSVRRATLRDAQSLYALVRRHSDELVPRSLGGIVESIDRFFVATCAGEIAGCASYQIHPELGDPEAATVEIVSVVVKSIFRRRGLGHALVRRILDEVRAFGPKEAVVLTFAPEFFSTLGFVDVPKTKVMHKLYTGCINCTKHTNPFTCPERAMLLEMEGENT